jgi:hypothetical protein
MTKDDQMQFRIKRPLAPLPSRLDFDPFGGDLDARCAWNNFGGLSLKKAYDLFLTNPLRYQEDFMFMGGQAFDYYFPVLDLYVREIRGSDAGDDCQVAILGSAVAAQFEWNGADPSPALVNEIEDLTEYVLTHFDQFSPSDKDQGRIKQEWGHVKAMIAEHKSKSEQAAASN